MTGISLANHLWQSTLIAGIAWIVTLALRRDRAGVRHAVWLAASLKFLVPFGLLVSAGGRFAWRSRVVEASMPYTAVADIVGQPFSQTSLRIAPQPASHATLAIGGALPSVLVAIWMLGALVLLVIWMVRWRRVAAVARSAARIDAGPIFDVLRRLEHEAGVRRPIALVSSRSSLEPGVFGIVTPMLVWPDQISEHLSPAQIEAVVAHEISHVRRRDNFAAALHMGVQVVFWFHPAVWWIGARLVDERERACDEAVVRRYNEPQSYAESILKVCQFYTESPLTCVAGVTGSDLKKRIEYIMTNDVRTILSAWKQWMLTAIAAVLVVGPVAVGVLSSPRLRAQPPAPDTRAFMFEAASIKPNRSDAPGDGGLGFAPDGIRARNQSPATLLWMAFGVQPDQIVDTPSWATTERFDVNAKVAPGTVFNPTTMFGPMLLNLLADRFKLKTHHETREFNVYRLVRLRADRLGPKLAPAAIDACAAPAQMDVASLRSAARRCSAGPMPGGINVHGMSLAVLASLMGPSAGRIIVDATGLTGNWDLELTFVNHAQSPDADGPSLFTAVEEQLGLKLEPGRAPVDVIVIDRLERPSED